MRRWAPALVFLTATSCGTETEVATAIVNGTALDHGRALFGDPSSSPAGANRFSCATCHRPEAKAQAGLALPGGSLAGVTGRKIFWGGAEGDLLRAINHCRFYFMIAQQPWTVDDEEAKALYAFLASLPGPQSPLPFTVVRAVKDLKAGDAALGATIFTRACQSCHGAPHSGEGRLTSRAPALPDQTIAEHAKYSPDERRLVFVEKVRHGAFLGYGGTMPPFSIEALSDAELAALLAFFQLYP